MAKNNELAETETSERTLTPELRARIEGLIGTKKQLASDQEIFNDDLAAVAEALGVKKAKLSRRINLIIKEEEKGGEVKSTTDDIDFVETYLNNKKD